MSTALLKESRFLLGGWVERLNDPLVHGSGMGDGLPVESQHVCTLRVSDGPAARVVYNRNSESLPIMPVYNFIRDYLD